MKYGKSLIILLLTIQLFVACSTNPLDVNIENSDVSMEFVDVDALLLARKDNMSDVHYQLTKNLGYLYQYELSMNLQTRDTSQFIEGLAEFYALEFLSDIETEKKKIETEVARQKTRIVDGFRYLHYHFPTIKIPHHVVFMNKLFSGIKANDSIITVAPENYIDPKARIIQEIPGDRLYQWQKDGMSVDYLARDILLFWIQHQLFQEIDEYLSHHIIQAGKILYVLKAAFPRDENHIILRYTEEQYAWAEENEFAFWEYLIREELLFKNNIRDKSNFLNEGPYTVGLPEKGPDRLGQFIGYKMVEGYMKQNKELSLQELIQTDYNTILQSYQIK